MNVVYYASEKGVLVHNECLKDNKVSIESGKDSKLLDELASSGVKCNIDDVVAITKTADGELDHQTVYAYTYFLRDNENIYRCYFFCSELKREEICYLAKMIIGNIKVTGESDKDGITLRKWDGKVK